MPTKIASYLTELGFKQVDTPANASNYNFGNAGEYIVVTSLNRMYRYDATSTEPADNIIVLNALTTGRWIAVGGSSMKQKRVSGTLGSASDTLPLTGGVTVDSKDEILYVNVSNTQLLADSYVVGNSSGQASSSNPGPYDRVIITSGQTIPAATAYEIMIFTGSAEAEETYDFAILPATLYQHIMDVGLSNTVALNKNFTIYKKTISSTSTLNFTMPTGYTSSLGVLTFELYIDMTSASNVLWTPTISWNGGTAPAFNSVKKYLLSFRTFDGGTSWIGNLEMEW